MDQLTLPETRTLRPQKPKDLLQDALAWIAENPKAWDFIVGAAQRDALECGCVRVKSYIEFLRYTPLPWATEVIKLPNAFSSAFGRILRAWHPELENYIPLQHSKLDGCAIPERPY